MIGLYAIIGAPLGDVKRGRYQLVQNLRVSGGPVGGDLGRMVPARSAGLKNRRAAARSRRWDSSTSMAWPYWSVARYR
jgi:hypothetical protein